MSGAKFMLPMLAADAMMVIDAQNEIAFKTAAQLRREAAQEERERRLDDTRNVCLVEMRDAYVMLQERDALEPQEVVRLRAECEAVRSALEAAPTDRAIREVATRIPDLIYHVRRAVAEHRDQAAWTSRQAAEEQQRRLREQRMEIQRASTELHALIVGLQADPMVTRWHQSGITRLGEQIASVAGSEQATPFLEEANRRAAAMITEAKAAQLKADQRDYIARGIMQSLAGMGFLVTDPTAEHPEHPASAKIVCAANAAGKSIAVSVPVEGEVWYEIDSYTKTTEATVGGGTALACDEGEQVLTEMHARLNEEFHVETGEIWWEDKDPQRVLRRAESLPATVPTQSRERIG
jgi:hypothetical protein